jgi:hypothetical protein
MTPPRGGFPIRWFWRAAAALASLPVSLRLVLVAAAVLHGCGLSWGMPASDAWDNDGIAPRDILPGLAATFTPGDYYTYPPLHLALLAVLTLPVTIVAIARAETASVPAVVREIIAAPYMTAFAMTARLVALVMSLGIALALGKIAQELCTDRARGERACTFTAAVASVGVTFTYYAHTSNLDVPSLFWGSLGLLAFVRAVVRTELDRLRRAAVFAALAVATKDQAYALFVIAVPIVVLCWFALDPWPRKNARGLVREFALALAIGAAVLAVVDGAVFNPTGFRARLAFLRGPASQDFSNYSSDLEGKLAIVREIGRELPRHYPLVFAPLIALGAAVALASARRASPRAVVAALTPLAAAASFTVAFNMAARRTDDRFLLPQMLMFAIYAGIGVERLWTAGGSPLTLGLARAACALGFAGATWEALRVDLTLLYEPRYATETYLAEHARSGDTIEVHGLNVYLPRFPAAARVVRVGPTPAAKRGPLPDVEEIQAPFMDIERRRPRYVVVSTCYAWRYLPIDTSSHDGHIYPPNQARDAQDADATAFFGGLFEGRLGYRMVHDTKIKDGWFRPIEIHASLNCRTTTFERLP